MLYVLTSQVCTTSPQSPCAALSDVLYGAWKSQHLDAVKYIGYTAWLQHLGTRRLITLQAGNGSECQYAEYFQEKSDFSCGM